jgi:hypothetical protein
MDDSPNQPLFEEKSTDSNQGSSQRPQVGPMAAIVIVVILLALGGIYFFITQEMKLHQTPPVQEQVNS